jgi:hypothetical protein
LLQDSIRSVQYRVVYDAVSAGYHTWWFGLAGLILVGVGAVMWRRPAWFGKPEALRRGVGAFAAIFGALWSSCVSVDLYREYSHVRDALRSGEFDVVEGEVTQFRPQGADGHPSESWTVAGHQYKIEPAVVTSGFRAPGVVRPGQRVRIVDVDGTIARLEIAQ